MAEYGLTENEATSIITEGVDFGMTQLVDGNWGVHAIVPKVLFSGTDATMTSVQTHGTDLPLSYPLGFFGKTLEPVMTIALGGSGR
jgi:hypothetical protein